MPHHNLAVSFTKTVAFVQPQNCVAFERTENQTAQKPSSGQNSVGFATCTCGGREVHSLNYLLVLFGFRASTAAPNSLPNKTSSCWTNCRQRSSNGKARRCCDMGKETPTSTALQSKHLLRPSLSLKAWGAIKYAQPLYVVVASGCISCKFSPMLPGKTDHCRNSNLQCSNERLNQFTCYMGPGDVMELKLDLHQITGIRSAPLRPGPQITAPPTPLKSIHRTPFMIRVAYIVSCLFATGISGSGIARCLRASVPSPRTVMDRPRPQRRLAFSSSCRWKTRLRAPRGERATRTAEPTEHHRLSRSMRRGRAQHFCDTGRLVSALPQA